MSTPEEWAQKLVDYVATVTQLDDEKGLLPNAEDWRRCAVNLFTLAMREAADAVVQNAREDLRHLDLDKLQLLIELLVKKDVP